MSALLKLLVVRDDNIPAFGAYHLPPPGAPKGDVHVVLLNCEAHFGELADEHGEIVESSSEERKRIMIETIMHEFGHALEQRFGLPDNEEAIDAAIASYQPKAKPTCTNAGPATPAAPMKDWACNRCMYSWDGWSGWCPSCGEQATHGRAFAAGGEA